MDSSPGLIYGGVRGGREVNFEFSLVVPGNKLTLEKKLEDHQSAYKREDCDQEDGPTVSQSPGDNDAVLICGSIKPVVESVKNPGDQVSLSLPLNIRVVPSRREHGVEGK
jgi:hypothetical protein